MQTLSTWYILVRERSGILRTWAMQVNDLNVAAAKSEQLCREKSLLTENFVFNFFSHADFFPNNGRARQPGCIFPFDLIGGCSHGRSYQYFAESIESIDGFMSLQCNSWQDYVSRKCTGEIVPMGFITPNTTRGTFYLETNEGPKFARYQKN